MKKTALVALLAIAFSVFSPIAQAKIKLPAIVSSNMVLQRNTTVNLWGWANPNEKITIKASWIKDAIHIEADKDGNWKTQVKTTDSKSPQSIVLNDIHLDNILFGEVWLCSGQSNMQDPVKGFEAMPVFGANMAIVQARNPNLRLFTVDRIGSDHPLKDVIKYSPWEEANSENVANFSAVAYYFGSQLQKALDVPVGLIHTSWGASIVQAWMSNEVLSQYQKVDTENANFVKNGNKTPTALYNAMLRPLIPFTIKGAIWYQGESNRTEPDLYKQLFPAMVKEWRDEWGIGDFPFYYVQIAPFAYGHPDATEKPENSAYIREVQQQCLNLIPNSGMAVTLDIGEEFVIHPARKKEVADRLLFNALGQTYGFKGLSYTSPIYDSLMVKNDAVFLKFKHADGGLYTPDTLKGFEIAGSDKVFYPAEAKIVNKYQVKVTSAKVPQPVAVRYAWRNWVVGSLFNNYLLPASSFRTDDWDDATQGQQ